MAMQVREQYYFPVGDRRLVFTRNDVVVARFWLAAVGEIGGVVRLIIISSLNVA